MRRLANVVGFDDAPFVRAHRGDVALVGVVCTQARIDGVLVGKVRRDGVDSTRRIAALLAGSPFAACVQAVLLQGIAVGGFNVVDIHGLHAATGLPVLVVARKAPGMAAIEAALRGHAHFLQFGEYPGAVDATRRVAALTSGAAGKLRPQDECAHAGARAGLPACTRDGELFGQSRYGYAVVDLTPTLARVVFKDTRGAPLFAWERGRGDRSGTVVPLAAVEAAAR